MGWVDPRVKLGWVGSWVRNISQVLKLCRPLVTAEVIMNDRY